MGFFIQSSSLNGKWSGRHAEFTTIFVTADSDLAKAAKDTGLRVWNLLKEKNPLGSDELG